jgi:hypothetical protein
VGQCRARLSSIFWDELRIRALGPRPGPAPAHTFSEQDGPHLAAAYLDAYLLGGLGERLQRPVGSLRLVFGLESASGLGEQLARRIFGEQGDDPGALLLCDAGHTARAGAVCEPVYPFGVEAVEAHSYGLRMTAEFLGYLGGAQILPAQRDDADAEDPVSGSVATSGEFAYLSLFLYVLGCAGAQ